MCVREGLPSAHHVSIHKLPQTIGGALVQSCRDKFEEPVASHQAIEDRANKALGLLTQR